MLIGDDGMENLTQSKLSKFGTMNLMNTMNSSVLEPIKENKRESDDMKRISSQLSHSNSL